MGQRQNDDEIVYGDNCNLGFYPGKTPKYLYVRFSKMVKCPDWDTKVYSTPPNDRVFKLTQHDGIPCWWDIETANWFIHFNLGVTWPGITLNLVHLWDEATYFKSLINYPLQEGHVYPNDIEECNHVYGAHGGIAVVTWKLESLKVMGLLNIKTQNDLFMEMRPKDNGARVYKYCKLKDATNIAIKYKP